MTKRHALDTNLFLRFPNIIELLDGYSLSIPSMILRELEKFENLKYKYGELAFEAREIRRGLKQLKRENKIYIDLKDYKWDINQDYDPEYMDNCILKYCLETGDSLITFDGLLFEKALELGIDVVDIEKKLEEPQDTYTGYKELNLSWIQFKEFEEGLMTGKNPYGLLKNEYLIVNYEDETGKCQSALRWDGEYYHQLTGKKSLKTKMFGDFKPYDIYQKVAIDSLAVNPMTMLEGSAGTGKTLIALNYEMQQLENGKVDKLIFFVNPAPTRNSVQLGFYKGTKDEKLLDSSVGNMLSSKFGDRTYLEGMIERGEILLLPFADIRGFDTTSEKNNYIVHILEAQNLDKDLMKLAIQRIGKNTKLIIDGDFRTQVDSHAYAGSKNGMRRASEVFKGTEYFGQVKLPIIYRSELAKRAELM
jgi:predicted ribonuclease YlaK